MDRNLGATGVLYSLPSSSSQSYPTYGLNYQWGRKDPFPKAAAGASGDNVATQPTYQANGSTVTNFPDLSHRGAETVAWTVQNPHMFGATPNDPCDWNVSRNDLLWGEGTTKSVYDPCPEGWRIAPISLWADFNEATAVKNEAWDSNHPHLAGRLYTAGSVKAFYPGSGYRRRDSGGWWAVCDNGYCWSSSTLNTDALAFGINFASLSPAGTHFRAYGFATRCVQE